MVLVEKRCCDANCIACALQDLLVCTSVSGAEWCGEQCMGLEYLSFIYTSVTSQ